MHWAYAFQYSFEFTPNARLKEQFFTANSLRRASGVEAERVRGNAFGQNPPWFAPKATADYEVWVVKSAPERNVSVLIDRIGGHNFIADYLV